LKVGATVANLRIGLLSVHEDELEFNWPKTTGLTNQRNSTQVMHSAFYK